MIFNVKEIESFIKQKHMTDNYKIDIIMSVSNKKYHIIYMIEYDDTYNQLDLNEYKSYLRYKKINELGI